MALENLRQAVGQAAYEAAPRALVEFKVKMQFAVVAFFGIDGEADIIGPFFRIAEQCIKEIVGSLLREKIVQTFGGKDVTYGHEGNLPCVGGLRNAQRADETTVWKVAPIGARRNKGHLAARQQRGFRVSRRRRARPQDRPR